MIALPIFALHHSYSLLLASASSQLTMSYPMKDLAGVAHLGESNYGQWKADIQAALMMKGCWRIVNGEIPQPADPDDLPDWLEKHDLAAGLIWLTLEPSQKAMVAAHQDDAIALWAELKSLHAKDSEVSRFIAYDELLSVTLGDGETLPSIISRVEDAVNKVKLLRPSTYTLQHLDDELGAMALIRSLPYENYGNFRSSLMLMTDIKFGTVKEAFMQEQRNRQPRAAEQSMALRTSSGTPSSSSNRQKCNFCTMPGHNTDNCYKLQDAKQVARKEVQDYQKNQQQRRRKGKGKGNKANAANEEAAQTPQNAEFAGNASLPDYSTPLSPLISDAVNSRAPF